MLLNNTPVITNILQDQNIVLQDVKTISPASTAKRLQVQLTRFLCFDIIYVVYQPDNKQAI